MDVTVNRTIQESHSKAGRGNDASGKALKREDAVTCRVVRPSESKYRDSHRKNWEIPGAASRCVEVSQ